MTRCGRQPVDGAFEHMPVVIRELVAASVVGVAQGADQEGRHLASGHRILGAERVIERRVAPTGDPRCSQALDGSGEDAVVVVEKETIEGEGQRVVTTLIGAGEPAGWRGVGRCIADDGRPATHSR